MCAMLGGNEMVNEVRRKLQAAEATIDQQRSSVELLRRRLDVVQGERDMLEAAEWNRLKQDALSM